MLGVVGLNSLLANMYQLLSGVSCKEPDREIHAAAQPDG